MTVVSGWLLSLRTIFLILAYDVFFSGSIEEEVVV